MEQALAVLQTLEEAVPVATEGEGDAEAPAELVAAAEGDVDAVAKVIVGAALPENVLVPLPLIDEDTEPQLDAEALPEA